MGFVQFWPSNTLKLSIWNIVHCFLLLRWSDFDSQSLTAHTTLIQDNLSVLAVKNVLRVSLFMFSVLKL